MQVSNARLKTYRRCPNQFRYKYVLKLQPKQRKVQLERGSWVHKLLMVDADGHDWREEHARLTKEFNKLWVEERDELGDLPQECARIMFSYKRQYKNDAQRYRVVDTELDEVVTLPNGLRIQIIVDKVMEDLIDGGLWAVDYKTRKSFADAESMMIDPQLTLYFGGLEILGYAPMRGAMYDEIRTKPPTVPELVYKGTSRERLAMKMDIDTDVYTYMREIRRYNLDPSDYAEILRRIAVRQKDKFFRRTPIPKDPPVVRTVFREAVQTAKEIASATADNRFPRSFEDSCRYSCDYKDLCITELYGGNILPLVKMNYTRRKKDQHK